MIPLNGKIERANLQRPLDPAVWLLVDRESLTADRRSRAYLVMANEEPPQGFSLYVTHSGRQLHAGYDYVVLPAQLGYLTAGDVIALSRDAERIRVLWRHQSGQNSILLTERCDNFCLMCSQPPRQINDDWLLDQALDLIRLLPSDTSAVNITGGEPTFYGARLIELLKLCRTQIPRAGIHMLSNGRRFSDVEFALAYADVDNPNMMVGIPVYGTEPSLHDYVVQARGAFNETIRGILNLGRLEQRIEIRVVIHKQTAPVLTEIAEFIARNLPFVDQVALMGLEMIGFARANLADVWIDPIEYRQELTLATLRLHRAGIRTMIYNHQLCLIEPEAWPFAVKSISDWKNEYLPQCENCSVRQECGGFFHSAKYRMSDHIKPILRQTVTGSSRAPSLVRS